MAATITTEVVNDGNNTAITGNVQAIDTSGVGSGPVAVAHVQLDATGAAIAAFGTGTRAATVQRVTIATDDVVPASQSGTWNITNVSGTVSLPTGAATAAKQPALGTAGAESADVITVQGAAGGTAVPISGTVTVAASSADKTDGGAYTAGTDGVVITGAACLTANPAYTTAKAQALSVTTEGGLRTSPLGVTLGGLISTSQSVTATTSTAATNFAATASKHNYITSVTVWNSSATNTYVKLQDGSGGTTIWVLPAGTVGGSTHNFDPPLRQPTANTALYFATADAVTTLYISINGYQAA